MLSQNPGCNRFHSSFDVFVCERSAFSDAADVLDRLANATIKKRSEDATPLLVNFLAKLVLAFVRSSEDNSGDDDVSIDEYSAYKKPRARGMDEWKFETTQRKTLSLSPDVENFRDINDRNERNKAFKGSLFLSLCVYISASLMKRRCMKRSERMIFRVWVEFLFRVWQLFFTTVSLWASRVSSSVFHDCVWRVLLLPRVVFFVFVFVFLFR